MFSGSHIIKYGQNRCLRSEKKLSSSTCIVLEVVSSSIAFSQSAMFITLSIPFFCPHHLAVLFQIYIIVTKRTFRH